ncbi:MAG: hypothetical protein LWX56_00410 [Ignavibacteria bacterium]|nr:hypothetical protein [Ignavibacteria bacterium]
MKKYIPVLLITLLFTAAVNMPAKGSRYPLLPKSVLKNDVHNTLHKTTFSKFTSGFNKTVLEAIDTVQAHAMDGGTYFIGVSAKPAESPVNYELKLGGKSLLTPPRSSSYCSGSSYAVFIETLNRLLPDVDKKLSPERAEAMRMQEPDGSRREDWVKFWGIWNADGFGSNYAMVQYAKMGVQVKPEDAKPGDFANISWKTGNGHSVVFLGWCLNEHGEKCIMYWASQKASNGYGDQIVPVNRIKDISIVRLTKPENIYQFDINTKIDKSIPGSIINLK